MSKKKPEIIRYTDDDCQGVLDLDPFTDGGEDTVVIKATEPPAEPKRKRGRPRKKDTEEQPEAIVMDKPRELPMCQSNEPYINTYEDTNGMLRNAIDEIDCMNLCVAKDLETIRSSKTMKNKYNYISDLTGISSNLIGTKITAIRELNKSKTDSHNLELKRMKDISATQAAETDDNKYIMDMYNAFVQTPVGNIPSGFMPNQMDFQSGSGNMIPLQGPSQPQPQNLTPAQNRMRLDVTNPNIKVVVVYNNATGEKHFDAMDVVTMERIPNYPLPSEMFLKDTVPYVNEGVARNVNLDQTYPLVVVNNNIDMY